jgi:hypothetical protein
VPARSLKEQFSRNSEAWKEQSDPIFRFCTEGDWWVSRFSLSVPVVISARKRHCCLYWPLATIVITGPKVLDFYGFCAHRATSLKCDGKDILSVTMVLNSDHSRADPEIGGSR